ncbi:MAG: response regulator [Myxococcota bacterium]|nr:response regulator [Myxococcota bacterium]
MCAWRILVVDDDPDIRRITALSLSRIGGFLVTAAASAQEALAKAAEELPDLILLDVSMPGADGPTTLALLRAAPRTSRVPVIFFTAEADEENAARLCALGAIGIITKPFDLAGLPGRIRDIVSGSGLE